MRRCKTCGARIPSNQAYCALHRAAPEPRLKIWTEQISEGDDEEPSWPRQFSFLQDLFSEAEVIGQGGFATVYRARRVQDDQVVALKVAHSRFAREQDAMLREVEVLQAIGGRGAPRWIESSIGVKDQPDYVVLEFIRGVSLAQRLASFGKILIPDARRALVSGLLDVVERVHDCGFVHNDLKPENLLLADKNRVLLCDFDLAQRQGEPVSDPELDACLGTAEYLAPERIAGRDKADLRSDIYALGIMLYELYAGHPPFWGSEVQVRESHRSDRVPSLKKQLQTQSSGHAMGLQEARIDALHHLVHRCLRKDPTRRPSSVAELRSLWRESQQASSARPEISADLGIDLAQIAKKASEKTGLQRSTVGVLWIYSLCDRADLLLRFQDAGCVLVNCERDHYAVVCGFGGLVNPVHASLEAAGRLLNTPDLRMQIVVDVATVFVAHGECDESLFLSSLWQTRDRYADGEDGRGLFITNPAHELIPELSVSSLEGRRYAQWSRGALQRIPSFDVSGDELVGQQELLGTLHRQLEAIYSGNPLYPQIPVHWVFGSPGRGKSFVSESLHRRLQDAFPYEKHIYWRLAKKGSQDAKEAFAELWRQLFGTAFKPHRVGQGPSRFLTQWQRQEILDFVSTRGPARPPEQMHDSAVKIAALLLRGICADRALVLVVDDAQLLHKTLLDAIRSLAQQQDARMLAMLFAQEPEDRDAVRLEEVEQVHSLKALDHAQSARMARQKLRHVARVPQEALDWIATRSAGNPMMITGLVRALGLHGVTYPDPKSHRWEIDCRKLDALPASPAEDWLLEREIRSWPPGLRSLAQWAAVLPDGFRRHHLEDLLDELELVTDAHLPSLDPDHGLARLAEADILYVDGARGYHFCHAQIRKTLLEQLGGEALRASAKKASPLDFGQPRLAASSGS